MGANTGRSSISTKNRFSNFRHRKKIAELCLTSSLINGENAAKHDDERNLPKATYILKNCKARSKRILKEITITVH